MTERKYESNYYKNKFKFIKTRFLLALVKKLQILLIN